VCDEIRRDEDPKYVTLFLHWALLGYVDPGAFAGKRLLDFGCGSGASTAILGRMFPETETVGVDLEENLLGIARKRAAFYGNEGVSLRHSLSGERLPDDLGSFDFVTLSAVFEHLLPHERNVVLGQIWSVLKPRGILFLNQTPFRFYPHEAHTTGLPGLNYLPDHLALRAARRFSARVDPDESWESLLRRGIRGGTEREVMRILRSAAKGTPVALKPERLGLRDTVDLWYEFSMEARPSRLKPVMKAAFKLASKVTGSAVAPAIDVAIAKR
jgi:ubiquinone/menaquinone biosynthesis C-methylase UbiE